MSGVSVPDARFDPSLRANVKASRSIAGVRSKTSLLASGVVGDGMDPT